MKATTTSALLAALFAIVDAAPTGDVEARDVDTRFPYTGPAVPIADWVDQSVNGNGKGFPRLIEPPAVKPAKKNPTNNINVISTAFIPNGINVHFQTPFGLAGAPIVTWGTQKYNLCNKASGASTTYDRTPPCSQVPVTMCSQFFHDVQITNVKPGSTIYYQIAAANGTTASPVMSVKTAHAAGNKQPFTMAVLNDMGYTNAGGTHTQLAKAASSGLAFAWHGGDISYADDWYSGVLPCQLTGPDSWPVCYNGTDTSLPGDEPIPAEYDAPLPAGEIPNQGGPQGGDISTVYEFNWDLWQSWMSTVTKKIPYMVLPGNHEAACAEFDGGDNVLTAYLNENKPNSTSPTSNLTYYSCPPSQRNFTTFQHRFRMPGPESGGVGNFWYSYDYGMAHFVALDSETDFAYSPEYPFIAETKGESTLPTESQTYITDSGPFGQIDGNNYKDNTAYQQYQWLKQDLANVDRSKTPWVFVMSHRPMYSSQVSSYQAHVRNAWQDLMLENKVDVYLAGHIHWYERLWPLDGEGYINKDAIKNNNTYYTGSGDSLVHLTNGMAGNIESHSVLYTNPLNITAVLNKEDYGFSTITFESTKKAKFQFIKGDGSGYGDELTLIKSSY